MATEPRVRLWWQVLLAPGVVAAVPVALALFLPWLLATAVVLVVSAVCAASLLRDPASRSRRFAGGCLGGALVVAALPSLPATFALESFAALLLARGLAESIATAMVVAACSCLCVAAWRDRSAGTPAPRPGRARDAGTSALGVLVLGANPKGQPELQISAEGEIVRAQLAPGGRARVDIFPSVAADGFAALVDEYTPTLLHFAGHGSEKGEPLLISIDRAGSQAASSTALQTLFRKAPNLRCVVFSACDSALVTQELVLTLPVVVIGMDGPINDRSSLHFFEGFYRRLAEGRSLPNCQHAVRHSAPRVY